MGTARSVFFTVSSIILIAAGVISLISCALIVSERIHAPGASLVLTLISAVIMVIYSLLNIISGISGVRSRNRRTNSAVVIRLPQIAIVLCLFAMSLSFFNGIMLLHILLLLLTGIIIPLLFIYATVKKSYV